MAIELRVPVTRITEILRERRAITADAALRLKLYFGMTANFWMAPQKEYKLVTVRRKTAQSSGLTPPSKLKNAGRLKSGPRFLKSNKLVY